MLQQFTHFIKKQRSSDVVLDWDFIKRKLSSGTYTNLTVAHLNALICFIFMLILQLFSGQKVNSTFTGIFVICLIDLIITVVRLVKQDIGDTEATNPDAEREPDKTNETDMDMQLKNKDND